MLKREFGLTAGETLVRPLVELFQIRQRIHLGIEIHTDIDRFIRISSDHRGRNEVNEYGVLQELWIQIANRNRGRIISAVDPWSRNIAACVVAWNSRKAYYWFSARRDDDLGRKANTVLIFEALSFAKQMNLDFDADGYATVQSGKFLSKLDIPLSLQAVVEKSSNVYNLLKPIKECF